MRIWYQSTLDFSHQPNYRRALADLAERVASPTTRISIHGRPAALLVNNTKLRPVLFSQQTNGQQDAGGSPTGEDDLKEADIEGVPA